MELFDLNEWLNFAHARDCEYYISDISDVVEFLRHRGESTSTILEYLCDGFGGDYEDIVRNYIDDDEYIYTR